MYKLLIVDDESLERDAIKYIVSNNNLEISEIKEAINGKEALERVAEFKPDIVTLDIKLPGLSGIEVGHIIKKIYPDIKIIFVTAYESFEYAHEAINIGVTEFIVKPGTAEKIAQILSNCINELEEERNKKEQKEKLDYKINQISGYLENEFVNSVVNGEIDEQQAEEYLMFMLNKFSEGFGVVVDINFREENSVRHIHRNMVKKRFTNKLSSLLDKNIKFMLNQVKNTIYILVFDYAINQRTFIKRLIEDEIQMAGEDLNDQLKADIYYGFGEGYDQISLLWKSFSQAKVASKNMYLDEIENCDGADFVATNLELREKELCSAIFNDTEEEVMKKADHILDNIIFTTDDMNAIRLNLYEFFILLNRYLNRESQSKHAISELLFDDLKNIGTRGEAKNYIHLYILEVLETIKQQNSEKEPILKDKVVEYIKTHFGESITLEDIANEVGFSTYYFGKIFKKTFKMTFTEYLTNLRIEQAKKHLKDDSITVKDVTYRVGYMDPNYFTRVFKKYEGVTPTEYRAIILEQH